MSPEPAQYDASRIQALEGLEAIRKRPGMYIGSTSERGLRNLVFVVVDRSVDEILAGRASRVDITLLPEGGVRVADDSRGVDLQVARYGDGPHLANALSSRLVAENWNDGACGVQEYSRGVLLTSAATPTDAPTAGGLARSAFAITFWPDPDIFEDRDISFDALADRLRELAFLNRALDISIADERLPERRAVQFHAPGGLRDMVVFLEEPVALVHHDVIAFERDDPRMAGTMEVAFRWHGSGQKQIQSFANSRPTPYAGTHVVGFHDGLKAALNTFARGQRLLSASDADLGAGRIGQGLTAVISVKLESPRFEGCTRGALGNAEVRDCVRDAVAAHLAKWLAEHPREAAAILGHILRKAPRDDLGPAA